MTKVSVTIDGVRYDDEVEPRMLLVHYLREVAGRIGTPVGCDTSNCGACTVLLNGLSAKSCAVLAVQADGAEITTIQGLANGEWHPLQQAFHEEHALQCGYCTPGMIMAAADLLRDNPNPTEQEVREGLEGNLCRCTGYQNIVRAVMRAAGGLGVVPPEHSVSQPRSGVMTVTTEIGKPRARKEDARLVTGQTNWTDNIQLPGMVHVAFVRSPMAHARITRVDVSAARSAPGVIAAFSGADFAAEQGSLPCAWPVTPDIVIPAHPPMATDEVRYVGEIVACVVARDRYAAADAFQLVDVDYEPLPAVLDMEAALTEGSPKVHEAGNKSFEWPFAQGDLDAAFRDAPVVMERTYRQQRLIPCAMEPRATVAAHSAMRSPCGRPPRSRTSCGSCSP